MWVCVCMYVYSCIFMYIYVYISTYHSMANKHHSHPRISRTSFTIPGLLCSHLQIKGSEPSRRKWAARLGAVDWFINGILTKSDDQTRHRWGLPEDGIHHLLRPKCGTEHFGTCPTVVWQRDTLSGIESKSLARKTWCTCKQTYIPITFAFAFTIWMSDHFSTYKPKYESIYTHHFYGTRTLSHSLSGPLSSQQQTRESAK